MKPQKVQPVPVQRSTATEDPGHGGNPRLIVSADSLRHVDDGAAIGPTVFGLARDVTTIGSGPDADLRLGGLIERHAEVRHRASDKYMFVAFAPYAASKVNGASVQQTLLQTGDCLELGGWEMSYYREELADREPPNPERQDVDG